MPILSGLTGDEIFCLAHKGYQAGELVYGNSVHSLGFNKTIEYSVKGVPGTELKELSHVLAEGRKTAYQRMMAEAEGTAGIVNVNCKMLSQPGAIEFFASGSALHQSIQSSSCFSTYANGKKLYLQLDAGFQPLSFVFGNVAYATGMTGGIIGKLKAFSAGEIQKLTTVFNRTRQLALERIVKQAKENKANAVVGITLDTLIFSGMNEMLLQGTASFHPDLATSGEVVTSHLTQQEMWCLAKMGYAPLQIVLASSVISLGFVSGLTAKFKSLKSGEVVEYSQLLAETRKNLLSRLHDQAKSLNAEEVVGVKIYSFPLANGLVEVMGVGTAIQKSPHIKTASEQVLPQAFCENQ